MSKQSAVNREARRTREAAENSDTGRRIPAAQFKAQCLSLLEQVRQSRDPVVVTKHGRPVAKLVPLCSDPRPIFGFSKGSVKILGDIVAPTGELWDADAD